MGIRNNYTTPGHAPVSRIRIHSLSMKVVSNDCCHSAQPSEHCFSFWRKILWCEMKGRSEKQPPPNCQTIIMNHIEGVYTTHDFYIFCSGKIEYGKQLCILMSNKL